jgi:hypothetical protein
MYNNEENIVACTPVARQQQRKKATIQQPSLHGNNWN